MGNKGDTIIKKSLDDVINSLPEPDAQPDWYSLVSRIEKDKKRGSTYKLKSLFKPKKYLIAALIFLLILISMSLAVSPTSAKNTLIENTIFKIRQNISSIFKISADQRIGNEDIWEEENDDSIKEFS